MSSTENSNSKKSASETLREQRAALQNFYKLSQQGPTTRVPPPSNSTEEVEKPPLFELPRASFTFSSAEINPIEIEDLDEFVKTEPYQNIIKAEVEALDSLNSSKSEIKSIIYNNYYELIKINNVLEDLVRPQEGEVQFEKMNENLDTIRKNIDKIKAADIDIFNDI